MKNTPLLNLESGCWYLYDGECPLCNHAAHAMRLKQAYGDLHLLNARDNHDHPLLKEVNQRKLNLDEGMVIYYDGTFYHGKEAMRFMAGTFQSKNPIERLGANLLSKQTLANYAYPPLKAIRNLLLKLRKVEQIDNLQQRNQPIFKAIFDEQWDQLPICMQRHYANYPYSEDKTIVEGRLNIRYHWIMSILKPFYRILGGIPIEQGDDIAITVSFDSAKDSAAFHFNRVFHFENKSPYHFRSRMLQVKHNIVAEVMRFNICWKAKFSYEQGKVLLKHAGYAFKLGNLFIPLPIDWLIGKGNAQETPVDDDTFDINVGITHPLFGSVYSYTGRFFLVN